MGSAADAPSLPHVSILIPCYNAAKYIALAIKSALASEQIQREVIVVDDGSSDGSADIAEQFTDQGVKVIRQKNAGAAAARNRAFRESAGEFIQYLDADDLIAPDKIWRQIEVMNHQPGAIAHCRWGRFYNEELTVYFKELPTFADYQPADFLALLLRGHHMVHPAAWLIPRDLCLAAGGWDERLSLNDDGEYFARVIAKSRSVLFVEKACSYYRSGLLESLSKRHSEEAWHSQFRAVDGICKALLSLSRSHEANAACANAYQRFIYESYAQASKCRRLAAKRVRQLGGSKESPQGGRLFQSIRKLTGWKTARHIDKLYRHVAPPRPHPHRDASDMQRGTIEPLIKALS